MNSTHGRIISAAKELFEKKGFAAATTKEIAALANVSEVTLFRHFENKRNLFEKTVHSCTRSYKIDDYLKNGVTYELDHDLTWIGYHIMEIHKQNAPMFRMIIRDKIRGSVPEMHIKCNEHSLECQLHQYFDTMKKLGKLSTDPKMAIKFYITNITGYFMREIFSKISVQNDEKYFAWMLKQVIAILKS
ncbi:MAG: TetR/AcrR family transcriptional regulator [Christensenellales bacterium]|jgi:hypothetical protein